MLANFNGPFLETISSTTRSLLECIERVQQNKEDYTGANLPPIVLKEIGIFTETLHKIHAFVDAQQKGFHFFHIDTANLVPDVTRMRQDAEKRHKEVLHMIEGLSDTISSDSASTISRVYSGSHNSSNSISITFGTDDHNARGRKACKNTLDQAIFATSEATGTETSM
ncbi:hypothetical protein MVEN_00455600 [Mycena venus]|uniref:Uncharacterized protein n=1 Tax=Mycena venus TaxID=2733690 RepID=A0A8H7D915_9AGAR|nr:hypothetical protein MVEN_00455600 [Mycena venus]